MFHSLVLPNKRGQPHDDGCQGRLDVLVGVANQLLYAGQNLSDYGLHAVVITHGLTKV